MLTLGLRIAALVLFIVAAVVPNDRLLPDGLACMVAAEMVPA